MRFVNISLHNLEELTIIVDFMIKFQWTHMLFTAMADPLWSSTTNRWSLAACECYRSDRAITEDASSYFADAGRNVAQERLLSSQPGDSTVDATLQCR